MEHNRAVNPKVLLAVAGVALVVFSAIAIFMAVGYSPETGSPTATTVSTTTPAPANR